MIIGLVGKMGSGKTTVATALQRTSKKTVKVVNFADSLKEMISNHLGIPFSFMYDQAKKNTLLADLGFDFDKSETIGTLLQKWGAALRKVHPNIFVMAMKKHVDFLCDDQILVIADVRYQNEYDWLLSQRWSRVVRLTGDPGGCAKNSTRNLHHESETQLDHLMPNDFHFDIHNDGSQTPDQIAQMINEKRFLL